MLRSTVLHRGTRLLLLVLLLHPGASLAQTDDKAGQFSDLLQQGFAAHQKSDYVTALPLLKRAHQLAPHDYFANLLLGIEYLRTGDVRGAIPFLQEAARTKPSEEFPHEYLAETYAKLGRYADADAAYERAMRSRQPSTEAITFFVDFALERYRHLSEVLRSTKAGLAEAYRLQAYAQPLDDPERAALLQRAIAVNSTQSDLWSDLALAQMGSGDWAGANTSMQRASAQDPNDLRAWEAEALILAKDGQWKQSAAKVLAIASRSEATAQKVIARWPDTVRPADSAGGSTAESVILNCLHDRAAKCPMKTTSIVAKSKQSLGDEASLFKEQRWDRIVALPKPTQAKSWARRGLAFANLGDCTKAIVALERGLSAAPNEAEYVGKLSRCYALRSSEMANHLQQSDDPAAVHMVRGDILLRLQGNASAADAEYRQALPDHQKDPALWERIAEAQLATGQMAAAKQSAETALQFDPHRLSPTRTLAKVVMEERDYHSALPYLRELTTRDPHDLTSQVELATACAQTGASEEALKYLLPALEHGYPDEKGNLHYLLGSVLRKMKRPAEANAAFDQARELSDKFQSTSRSEQ